MADDDRDEPEGTDDIAIVGMAAHLPGAPSVADYWRDLRAGTERVRPLSDEELEEAGVPREVLLRPGYVKAAAPLDGVYDFDPDFFGLSPKEAGIMDPQHRHFLMCAWEAMEDAGHVPSGFDGAIGIFAGCGTADYYRRNVLSNPGLVDDVGLFLLRHTGNDKDFLVTRASYLFDLQGPAVNVQTACSTSLVATHLAVQHLLNGECDLALAGGVTIEIPHRHGYQYVDGEILSPDGHCRAFDHRSAGTVFGSGAGVVVLRRLEDALDDGDHVYAVIRGTAVNNDGSRKVGYLAPSVDGQAECIAEALAVADVESTSIGYVECHGTGTPVGDPIEVAALSQAFQADGPTPSGFCGIGSVKTNIGHLDTAAGVAALIKATLAVHHGEIPPSLNFEAPNPILGIEDTPFSVVDELRPWPADLDGPRRAGVNSLGVGGTNAFAVIEEAPEPEPVPDPSGRATVVALSARSRKALDAASARLAAHIRAHPDLALADVAWTLQTGRHAFAERRVLAAHDLDEVATLLEDGDNRRVHSHTAAAGERSLAFMFPGGGAQHPRMAADLYATEPVVAATLDEGFRILLDEHGVDLRPLLLDDVEGAAELLEQPRNQIPAIFLVELAVARLLIEWGLTPTALVGHSMGENTAACLSGTMSFADALGLVALRGRLFEQAGGGMVVAPVPPDELTDLLDELDLDLAVVNAPDLSVVSGPRDVLDVLRERLAATGVEAQTVRIDTAPHSRLLDPVLDEFGAYLRSIELRPPTIPWVSNRTGTWITEAEATDPDYWVAHMRGTVRFSDCVATLAEDPNRILLEVGPGKTLSSLVRGHPAIKAPHEAIPTMRHPEEQVADDVALRTALGRLWAVGVDVELDLLVETDDRRRLPLPTYPFQTQPFLIEPGVPDTASRPDALVARDDEDRWEWEPVWRSRDVEPAEATGHVTWMLLADRTGLADDLASRLRHRGDDVVVVRTGDSYQALSDLEYVIAPENGRSEYESLFHDVILAGHTPDRIVHLALIADGDREYRPGSSFFHRNQELGFQSLVLLAQAWDGTDLKRPLHISVATMGSQRVVPDDRVAWPEQATVLGPVMVIPRELPGVTVSTFDIDPADLFPTGRLDVAMRATIDAVRAARDLGLASVRGALAEREKAPGRDEVLRDMVLAEVTAPAADVVAAIRGDRRYVRDVRRALPSEGSPRIREGATVLITGGLGGIGLTVAAELHRSLGCRIVLVNRSEVPERDTWGERAAVGDPLGRRIAALLALEDEGVDVTVVTGDVTDIDRMREVVAGVRASHGGIHAVVHAAGAIDDGPLIGKDLTDLDEVLSPKVYGTLVLEEVLADDDLDLFVAFSSTSAVIAPVGQVDYVAANSFLDALAGARHAHGRTEYLTLGWGVWGDVGMAADATAAHDAPTARPAAHLLLDSVTTDHQGVTRVDVAWDATSTWVLDEHRTAAGEALLPGAGYPELARAALAEIGVSSGFELSDLLFLRPLAAHDDRVVAQIVLTPDAEGYRFRVRQAVEHVGTTAEGAAAAPTAGWVATAEATLRLRRPPPVPVIDLAAAAERATEARPVRTAQQDHLRFGPRWAVTTRVRQGDGESLAWLHLPDAFAADLDDVDLHPALFDLGTGFAMDLIPGYAGDTLWVPIRYDRIRVLDRLGADVVARARIRPTTADAGVATFDVELCHPDGTVAVEVQGFSIRRLDGPLDVAPAPRAGEIERDVATDAAPSAAEFVLRHNVSQGIRAEEGARAFGRAIRLRSSPVRYVTSLDLVALRAQTAASAAAQLRGGGDGDVVFARPDIDTDFVEARDELERTLVGLWQELLGISEVGVHDDFFDLGGHSLIAVRLFARVRKLFSVDFPVSVLFDAPTIEGVAALIREARPDRDDADGDADADGGPVVVAPRPRYRHLVAMHPGEGGPGLPFFLVAGMFGNVMNLRQLAHRIGDDRPFFGVQARGLYGGEEPHEDFVEMARAYLEEIRDVQPTGPYLLGGFSGGGITAVEMALQLREQGEDVGAVVLLDTPTPLNPPLTWTERLKVQRDNVSRQGVGYVREWATNRVRWEQEKRRRREGTTDEDDRVVLHSTEIERAFYRAIDAYEMRRYPGVLTLFRPKLDPLHVFGPDRQINIDRRFIFDDNGWGPWCDRVDVTEVPGTHDSAVLEPHVRVLAAHLRATLDAADATTDAER